MIDTDRTAAGGAGQGELPIDLAEFKHAMALADLEDIIDELVATFLDDAPARMVAIEAAVESNNAEKIRSASHAYKSSAANMHAKQLAALLNQLESAGIDADSARAANLLPAVRVAHDAAVTELREHFG